MKDKKNKEIGEDATQYGEFVSSYFSWVTPEEQRKRTKEIEKMTKKEEKR